MSIEVSYERAPSHWASYLINGDASGMADSDHAKAEAWEAKLAAEGWHVASTVEDSEDSDNWSDVEYIVHRELGPCVHCGDTYSRDERTNGLVLCHRCSRRELRRARNHEVADGKVVPFYVAAIATSRAFGGREEGGWWYDVTEHREVRRAYDWRQGLRHARELREEHPTCRRGRYSVIGGDDVDVRMFRALDDLPDEGPFGRQRYA